MNFVINNTPGARSIARPVDQQSSMLPLYHGCPSLVVRKIEPYPHKRWDENLTGMFVKFTEHTVLTLNMCCKHILCERKIRCGIKHDITLSRYCILHTMRHWDTIPLHHPSNKFSLNSGYTGSLDILKFFS